MKSNSSLRFIWIVNAGLVLGAVYTGYWVFTAEASQPVNKRQPTAKARAHGVKPDEASQDRTVTEEDLRKVFARRFAPPGAKDQTDAERTRQMLNQIVPVGAPSPPKPEAAPVKAPETAPALPPQPEIIKPDGPPLESLITVVGVFDYPEKNRSGVVVLKKKTREQNLCMLGERPQGIDAKVIQIKVDTAVFEYLGRQVSLKRAEQTKGKRGTPYAVRHPEPDRQKRIDPKYHKVVKRSDVMQAMSRPVEVMKGIKYAIVREKDKVVGFRIAGVTDSSMFGTYGMRNNDIVRAVNGKPLDETFNPILMMTDIVASDVIRVDLRRNNRDVTLTFELGQ